MTVLQVIEGLEAAGFHITASNGRLRIEAPPGQTISAMVAQSMAAQKADVLEALDERANARRQDRRGS